MDSASALSRDNLLKIMVVMIVYLITTVNYSVLLREDNPGPAAHSSQMSLEFILTGMTQLLIATKLPYILPLGTWTDFENKA